MSPGRHPFAQLKPQIRAPSPDNSCGTPVKRQYGWDRARLDGLDRARTWTVHGVLARNLVKIAALTA
jgi:hypothetical protein